MPSALGALDIFGQQFAPSDIALIALLVVMEGVLSIDNALVLGLLAKRLPRQLQSHALLYGLAGAFCFRFIAIGLAAYLLYWRVVKLLGGAYLIYVSAKYFFFEADQPDQKIAADPAGQPTLVDEHTGGPVPPDPEQSELAGRSLVAAEQAGSAQPPAITTARRQPGFWSTVAVIEMTDVAFAVDSILAAIALVGSAPAAHAEHHLLHPKMWVIITGGMLGVIMMRFAAVMFIRLLERFPRLETSAYLLVLVIGAKLLADWWFNSTQQPHRVDFNNYHHPAFWIFWILMTLSFAAGFIPRRKT